MRVEWTALVRYASLESRLYTEVSVTLNPSDYCRSGGGFLGFFFGRRSGKMKTKPRDPRRIL